MPILGLFGISNDGLNLAVNLLVVLLVVVYLALIVWTFLDARRRIEDKWLVACATAASLFPFVGSMIYSILRPPEFIEDRKERELEIRASELRVKQLGEQSCPNCRYPVERNYLRCPNCEARLKDPCPTCQKPVDPRWAMCPYCETPVRQRSTERSSRSRRRQRSDRWSRRRGTREGAAHREPPSRQRAARAPRRARRASSGPRSARPSAAPSRATKGDAPHLKDRPSPEPRARRPDRRARHRTLPLVARPECDEEEPICHAP